MESACNSCKKGPPEVTLKQCSGCSQTQYCSHECQKKDWKSHKKTCRKTQSSNAASKASTSGASTSGASTSGASTSESKSASARPTHDMPFTRLDQGTWLHDRPERETYQLLIDAYRLRVEDTYTFRGELMEGSLYDNGSHGLRGFRKFLKKAATVPGLLPPWWNDEKKRACEQLGMDKSQWSDLHYAVDKSDIRDHYKDSLFPMKLRMFGDAIYGFNPSGTDGTVMRMIMMAKE
ncbi:putative MYND domain protein, partial [Trichoderma reesei RUT C-30]